MSDRRGQVIALAGVAQFSLWAHRLAQHGERREERLTLAVDALLSTDPPSAEAVFGGLAPLQPGLGLLETQLSGQAQAEQQQEMAYVSRYAGQLLRHAGTVLELPHTLALIREELSGLQQARSDRPGQLDPAWVKTLAELYVKCISPLRPRIMVTGNPLYLRNEDLAAGIRGLLFAGLRSGVLWRQCGGRMWQLLLNRKAILGEVRVLRTQATAA